MLMLDFDKICRFCLTNGENMVSIFGDTENCELTLSDRIQNCTCLKLAKSDGLPSEMCRECLSKLDLIKQFQDLCERSDAVLRSQLQAGITTDKEHILRSKQEGNVEYDPRKAKGKDEERASERNLPHELPFCEDLQQNQSDGSRDLPAEEQESGLQNNLKDCEKKPKKCHSGPRKCKKIKSVPPLLSSAHDDQENTMDFEDHEYSWPGSLSDEEFEPNQSGRQDRNESRTEGDEKRKGKVYECEYCGRGFSRSNHLAQHELTHTKEKPFHCSYCDKGFWYKNSLISHIKQTHTGDVNFTCEECGRGFFQRSEFMRHLPIHSDETPFKCEECGMKFKLMKNLRRHQKVHSGTRTHTCQYCGKSFRMLQTLRVHLITHSGEKPYKCSHCDKGFSQSAPLKAHIRSMHTGEKPYVCNTCGEAFPTGNTLKSHIFKHTGIHPYSCSACSVVFKRKKDLTDHCDIVHGGFVTSPVKVPPQLPPPLQDQANLQDLTSNVPLEQPMRLQDHQSAPAILQPSTKLEPHFIDVGENFIDKTNHTFSEDSISCGPVSHNQTLVGKKPETLEISPLISSQLILPLVTSPSADALLTRDCLPFS